VLVEQELHQAFLAVLLLTVVAVVVVQTLLAPEVRGALVVVVLAVIKLLQGQQGQQILVEEVAVELMTEAARLAALELLLLDTLIILIMLFLQQAHLRLQILADTKFTHGLVPVQLRSKSWLNFHHKQTLMVCGRSRRSNGFCKGLTSLRSPERPQLVQRLAEMLKHR
jgi:hypothetical protein